MFQTKLIRKASLIAAAAAGISLVAGTASAQMFEQPRQFKARDGAGLAVFMRNLQGTPSNSVVGGGDSTFLVCGGSGGQSSATANSSCIILNNSDASSLGIGQDSDGNQDADATTESTTNNSTTTADEVSNILNTQ